MSDLDFVNSLIEEMKRTKPPKMPLDHVNDMQGANAIVAYLSNFKDGISAGTLSDAMNVSTARIAVALNSLESKGIISRKTCDNDKRKVVVSLTEEGRDYSEKVEKGIRTKLLLITNELGQEEMTDFIVKFKKIKEILERNENNV